MKQQDGYTLIELMVTLLVTMILGGVLFTTYLAATQWLAPWRREIKLEDHVHLITHRLAADLTYAEQLFREAGGRWTMTYSSGRRVTYRYQDSTLFRNGHRLHDVTLPVAAFRLTPSREETRYALRQREGRLDDAHSLIQVDIHLALQSRERTLAVTTRAALRQQRPWPPL